MPESLTQSPAQEQDRDARSLFAKRKDKDKRCGWKLQNTQAGPFLDTTHPLPHSHQEVLKMLAVLLRDEGHGPSSKTLRLTPLLLSPRPPYPPTPTGLWLRQNLGDRGPKAVLMQLRSNQPALLCLEPGAQTQVWSGQLCGLGAQSALRTSCVRWNGTCVCRVREGGHVGFSLIGFRHVHSCRRVSHFLWRLQVVGGGPIPMIYCSVRKINGGLHVTILKTWSSREHSSQQPASPHPGLRGCSSPQALLGSQTESTVRPLELSTHRLWLGKG